MIPRTSARRLETTLVSYSRQRLPRPARLYSTPTKKTEAPAFAQKQVPHPNYPPRFAPQRDPIVEDASGSFIHDMQGFLQRRVPYTILPTPLPGDGTPTALNNLFFMDSPTQDQLAVMDACLHNLYDVPRAKQVFEGLRKT
ncbi:hypothetical protein HYDPIDRAFT_68101, partial [Hydnomerulius pinastri MD-312]